MADPLSDDQAYDRLHAALLALGLDPGATVRADTALKAARKALTLLQIGLLAASERGEDQVAGVSEPSDASPLPSPD